MDDGVRVELDAPAIALPILVEAPIIEVLASDDSALANSVRRLTGADEGPTTYSAFTSAVPD